MNKYDGRKMLNSSRFKMFIRQLNIEDKEYLSKKVDEYVNENNDLCDKGNYQHLSNIFTSMALYEYLMKKGKSKEEAFDTVSNVMYEYMEKQKRLFQSLSKFDIAWSILKKIVPVGFKHGSGKGWKFTWYKDDPDNIFRFECNKCIYPGIFKKYGLEEFGPMFCKNDILVYGEMNRIDFKRTGTLSQGYDKCDFCFVKYPKNVSFSRSKSQ